MTIWHVYSCYGDYVISLRNDIQKNLGYFTNKSAAIAKARDDFTKYVKSFRRTSVIVDSCFHMNDGYGAVTLTYGNGLVCIKTYHVEPIEVEES